MGVANKTDFNSYGKSFEEMDDQEVISVEAVAEAENSPETEKNEE